MKKVIELETERLKLRQWNDSDFPIFSRINADASVMEYYPSILSEAESNGMATKLRDLISERSWGFWAVETKKGKEFIGFVGLHKPTYDLPVKSCVEIGWRLSRKHWGKGYATEAANECLRFAFEELMLSDIYSFTSVTNKKSWSVMERLGMKDMEENFEHPIIPEGHPLREHVLYKISADQFSTNAV